MSLEEYIEVLKKTEPKIKVEKAIKKRILDKEIKAIRIYPSKLLKEVNSTLERGEKPVLLIKKAFSPKRNIEEIEIVFLGDYHIEDFSYYKKDPKDWKSWGELILSKEGAKKFAEYLLDVVREEIEEIEKIPKKAYKGYEEIETEMPKTKITIWKLVKG